MYVVESEVGKQTAGAVNSSKVEIITKLRTSI